MSLFNRKNQDKGVKWLLKRSRPNFDFDKKGMRASLIEEIREEQMAFAAQRIQHINRESLFWRHRWAVIAAGIVLILGGSTTTMMQAASSHPGDTLYTMGQWQETVMLNLPLPAEQKAQIQTYVVDRQNQDLDYLLSREEENQPVSPQVRTEAVRRSTEKLERAIESVWQAQERAQENGREEKAGRMSQALERLNQLADDQEKKIERFAEQAQDDERKRQYLERLEEIREYRQNRWRK